MSTTVDERVVEMRFDNAQFESNVSTSMSTLDKLKQKLNLSGATKGLEDIDSASKKVNMSSLGSAVDSVRVKFSALDVIATTALANITNSAVNAGKKLVASLSIDQISAGWEKYSDKTVSVATLVAQGNALEDVNDQLDRLNWFTDETSYNFTEMVSNIAKFTATGQDLETSVTAMEGIATWAALSGQNASTASRAMYQLSQAMGAGVMRLEDYKSIQNASMDTEEFRQKCIDAAISLGTLKDNGDGTYSSLVDGAEDASWSISQFASHLTKGLWLTSDVMMEVFNNYSSAVGTIYDAAADSGKLASEVIDEIHDKADELKTDAMTDSEAIDAAIKSLGYTLDDGSLLFDSFGLKAFEAAQKARTFKDAIDSVKDAVSTGWMNTFELIFGDAEEATELWTDLANTLWDVFASGGERRNTILEYALHFVDAWDTITQKLNAATFGKIEAVGDVIEKTTNAISGAIGTLEYYQDIVTRVWIGYYNNRGDNPDRYDLLSAEGYNPKVVQDLVNLGYGYALTMEDVEAACKRYGITLDNNTDITEGNTEATGELLDVFGQLTDEQLKEAGLTEDEISLYRALEKEAKRLGISISDLAKEMSEQDGRTLLIEGFKNLLDTILGVGTAIKSAWADIFHIPTIGESAVTLYSLIKRFNEFTEKIRLTDKETGELNETGMKLQRTFKGIIAVFKVITTILSGAWKIAFKVVSTVLNSLGLDILDVTAALGDMLVALSDWILKSSPLVKLINKMIAAIPPLVKKFKEWFAVFKETPAVQKLISAINKIVDAFRKLANGEINIGEFAAMLGTNLAKGLASLPKLAIQIGKDFIAGFKNGIGDSIKNVINNIVSFCTNFVSSFASALGVHSPSWKAYNIAIDFFQGFINGAGEALSPVLAVLKTIGEKIVEVFKSFWNYLQTDSGDIDWTKIFIGVGLTAILMVLNKIVTAFTGCSTLLEGISSMLYSTGRVVKSFSKVLDGVAWDLKAKALRNMAISIAILVAAIWVLCTIDDIGKLWNAVGVIFVLAAILVALAFAMSKLSSVSVSWNKGPQIEGIKTGLLQIGLAILLVAAAVKMIGDLDKDKAERGFIGLTIIAGGMLAFLAAMAGISRFSGNVDGVGKMMKQLAIAMLLMVVVCKLAGNLSVEEMGKGALFAAAFAIFVMAITSVAKGSTKEISKVGSMVLKLTIAMMLMVLVCKLAAKLSAAEMFKGALFAAGFAAFVGALVAVTKISSDKQIAKVGSLVFSLSISMLLMIAVCKLAAKLSKEEMLKGAAFAAGFVILVAALVKILKVGKEEKIAKITGVIIAVAFVLAIMAALCVLLGYVDTEVLAKGVTVVSILGAMLALMIKQLKGAQNVKVTMIAMAAAIAIMAAAVVILSDIETNKLIKSVAAMVIMMGMLALVIKSMSKLKAEKVWPTMLTLAGIMLVMAGILVLLDSLNVENSIKNAIALSTLMLAMAGVLKILTAMELKFTKALKSALALSTLIIPLIAFIGILMIAKYVDVATETVLQLAGLMVVCTYLLSVLAGIGKFGNLTKTISAIGALTLMIFPLLAFVLALYAMDGIKNAERNAKVLASLATTLTLLLIPLTLVGALIGATGGIALSGLLALTLMLVPMLTMVLALKRMNTVPKAQANAELLIDLMTTMTNLLIKLSLVGPLAIIGVAAMTGLTALILGIAVIATAIGGLVSAIPQLKKFLKTGLPILEQLTGSIGTMVGNFISAISGAVGKSLIKVGEDLETFTASLSKAADNANGIPSGSFDSVGEALLALLEVTGSSVLTSIGDLFSGGSSVENFVNDASILFEGIAEVGKSCSGIQIDQEAFDSVVGATQSLADLQSSLEPIGGVVSWFTGRDDLATFGANLVDFFDSMKIALKTLKGLKVNEAALEAVIDATERLSELQSSLEPIGGVVSWFTGHDDLATFGANLVDFFDSMKIALETLKGLTVDQAALDAVIDATERLSEVQSSLEPIGGVISWFKGRDDLATFGDNLVDFFASMKVALSELEGLTVDTVALGSIIDATERLSTLQKSLDDIGGVVDWFTGYDDLGSFGEGIVPFAEGMRELAKCGTIDKVALESMVDAGKILSDFQKTLPSVGGVVDWFTGGSDLGEFGSGVESFAVGMKALAECGTINMDTLDNLLTVGDKLTEFQSKLGGVITWFVGNGEDLSTFGKGTSAFAKGMQALSECKTIDEKVFESIITAAEDLNTLQKKLTSGGSGGSGILSWFNGNSQNLASFGRSVRVFMNNIKDAFATMDGIRVDKLAFNAIEDATDRLITLQQKLESGAKSGGIMSWFIGNSQDLASFGESVEGFMKSMRAAFSSMSEISIKEGILTDLIDATKELDTLQAGLTSRTSSCGSGILSWFIGHKMDLAEFGDAMETFMKSMRAAFSSLDDTSIDLDDLETIINATKKLDKLQAALTSGESGGIVSWFAGNKMTLDEFGTGIESFAKGMKALGECTAFDIDEINELIDAAERFGTLTGALETDVDPVLSWFSTNSNLKSFGNGIKSLAEGMRELATCEALDSKVIKSIIDAAEDLADVKNTLDTNVDGLTSWFAAKIDTFEQFSNNIEPFATGMKALADCEGLNTKTIDSIIEAAKSLAGLQEQLEYTAEDFEDGFMIPSINSQQLTHFSSEIEAFANAMKTLGECGEIDEDVIDSLMYAVEEIQKLKAALTVKTDDLGEATSGIFTVFGSSSLKKFSSEIEAFAGAMAVLSECAKIDADVIDSFTYAVGAIKGLKDELEDKTDDLGEATSGIFTVFGSGSLKKFSSEVESFAEAAKTLGECPMISTLAIASIVSAFNKIVELKKSLETETETDATSIGDAIGNAWNNMFNKNSSFQDLCDDITTFATAMTSLTDLNEINANVIESLVSGANLIKSFASEFDSDFNSSGLDSFGDAVLDFATGMGEVVGIATGEFNLDTLEDIIDGAKSIKTFALNLGINQKNSDALEKFGDAALDFATGMGEVVKIAKDGFESDTFTKIVDGAEEIKSFATDLGSDYDSSNLEVFSDSAKKFAGGMGEVVGIATDGFNSDAFTKIVDGAKKIKTFATNLGFNEKNYTCLDTFSDSAKKFAGGMGEVVGIATDGFNSDAFTKIVDGAGKIKTFAINLGFNEKNYTCLDTFSDSAKKFAGGMGEVVGIATDGFNLDAFTKIVDGAKEIKSFATDLGSDYDSSNLEVFSDGATAFATGMHEVVDIATDGFDLDTFNNVIAAAGSVRDFANTLLDFDTTGLDSFNTSVSTFATTFAGEDMTSAVTAMTDLKTLIADLCGVDTTGADSFAAALDTISSIDLKNFVQSFVDASSSMGDAGTSMIEAFVTGITNGFQGAEDSANSLITKLVGVMTDSETSFATAGSGMATELANGFSDGSSTLTTTITTLLSNATTSIRDNYDSFYNAGSYLVTGFCNGISENSYKAAAKAKTMAEAAVEAAREELDINSPSKVFKKIGAGVPEGFAIGIGMLGGQVKQSVSDMASTAIKTTRSAMATVLDALNADMDAQPTIRPVVDLTDVRSGANAINGLLADTRTLGVNANLNAINFAMNRKLQNGSNDDVVSAINDLNDSIGNVRGNTYNLGGITYSNGDEVAEAVQTIVRAALMGRRA